MSDFINRPQIQVLSAADGDRRRYWSDDDKLRIAAESFIDDRQAAATARRQYRKGELGSSRAVSFAPVTVTNALAPQINSVDPCPPPDRQVEIVLPNGRRVIVPVGVDTKALSRILSAVDGQ